MCNKDCSAKVRVLQWFQRHADVINGNPQEDSSKESSLPFASVLGSQTCGVALVP